MIVKLDEEIIILSVLLFASVLLSISKNNAVTNIYDIKVYKDDKINKKGDE